jgi:saccharopine dehydrogenase (NAD+, L-lysine-forming)
MRRILILGGYGASGWRTARWLLRETDCSVVLAGRHEQRAAALAGRLNEEFPGRRVSATMADAASAASLDAAFRDVDLVLVCSTTAPYAEQVARTALARGIDYLDIHFSPRVPAALEGLAASIQQAGRCFITQAGFHPGLLAPLVRFAAGRLTECRKATVGLLMNLRLEPSATSGAELIEELGDYQGRVFEFGQWRRAGWRDRRRIDFATPFGERVCYPLDFPEVRRLPQEHGLSDLGCYVAGFNWFVDSLVLPAVVLLGKVRRGLGTSWLRRCFVWGINTFTREPLGVVFALQAEGSNEGVPALLRVRLRHDDGYEMTAIAVVACLKQYLDGTIRRPGLWLMGEVVEPVQLFGDLERMGVAIEVSEQAAVSEMGRSV